jgi:hypothetical protein
MARTVRILGRDLLPFEIPWTRSPSAVDGSRDATSLPGSTRSRPAPRAASHMEACRQTAPGPARRVGWLDHPADDAGTTVLGRAAISPAEPVVMDRLCCAYPLEPVAQTGGTGGTMGLTLRIRVSYVGRGPSTRASLTSALDSVVDTITHSSAMYAGAGRLRGSKWWTLQIANFVANEAATPPWTLTGGRVGLFSTYFTTDLERRTRCGPTTTPERTSLSR